MNRERLTITLRADLLKQLDGLIDGQRLRNRSHAIEYFLSRSLGAQNLKVLVLAGGKPVYFDSEKKALPKAMVKIAGKPLLEQTLLRLKASKFSEVIISIGEGGENIENYFGDGSRFGISITYLYQKELSGRHEPGRYMSGNAQPLLQAREILAGGPFLLLYGDVLSDVDFGDLVEFHRAQKSSVCTMALTSAESVNMWGLARLQGNRVVEFEEKPKNPKTFSRLVNAGVYMAEPEIFSFISQKCQKLESDVFPRLAEEGKLFGYPYEGLWLDISNSAAYRQAVKELIS
ncbi:MAG: sugar phosphate nucleotidyltransferase [Candidatus Doudnabacteria bacterium]|nr:sugar phosphate nucleotidyltransferase [Candidatus Doudnabacteria bacterium]